MTISMSSSAGSDITNIIKDIKEEMELECQERLKTHLKNVMKICSTFEEICSEVSSILKRAGPTVLFLWREREQLSKLNCTPCVLLRRFFLTIDWVHRKHTLIPTIDGIKDADSAHMSDLMKHFWVMTELYPDNGFDKSCPDQISLGRWHWIMCQKCVLLRSNGDILYSGTLTKINEDFLKISKDADFERKIIQIRNWTWFRNGKYFQLFISSDGRLSEGGNIASMEEIFFQTKEIFDIWRQSGRKSRRSMMEKKIVEKLGWETINVPYFQDDWDQDSKEDSEEENGEDEYQERDGIDIIIRRMESPLIDERPMY